MCVCVCVRERELQTTVGIPVECVSSHTQLNEKQKRPLSTVWSDIMHRSVSCFLWSEWPTTSTNYTMLDVLQVGHGAFSEMTTQYLPSVKYVVLFSKRTNV